MLRNSVGWRDRLARLRGSSVLLDLRRYDAALGAIGALGAEMATLTVPELHARAGRVRDAAAAGQPLVALRAELFALARELSRHLLGMRPFDEQIVAALAMDEGAIVEMQTGEGKTLAAVMPAALKALAGRGVHVLTFNDYLARRDAEWMGPIYRGLGLSVAFVQQGMTRGPARRPIAPMSPTSPPRRRASITCAICSRPERRRSGAPALPLRARRRSGLAADRRGARAAGHRRRGSHRRPSASPRLAALVASLTPGVHFDTDEYGRDVELTEAGHRARRAELGCGSLHAEANLALLTELNCALHARALLRRDVDYIVRDGRIGVVDEFTGRVVPIATGPTACRPRSRPRKAWRARRTAASSAR